MGILVGIMGKSGSGKTASLRNMDGSKVGIFKVINKPFSFRAKGFDKVVNGAKYEQIKRSLKSNKLKTYVIDDSSELLVSDAFSRAKETGYGKFTSMASDFKQLIDFAKDCTSDDTIVFFLHHAVQDEETGFIKWQILGKILEKWVAPESYFSINLLADKLNGNYFFMTDHDNSSVKAPLGMFESKKIPNDLAYVEEKVREYYGIELGEGVSDSGKDGQE